MNQQASQVTQFSQWVDHAVSQLLAGYPGQTRSWGPEQHRDFRAVIGPHFAGRPMQVVSQTIMRLHKASPQWIPTAGVVRECVEACLRDWERAQSKPTAPPSRQLESNNVPREPEAQKAYVQEAKTELEKLARSWDVEAASSGRPALSPEEEAKRRFAELSKALNKTTGPLSGSIRGAINAK